MARAFYNDIRISIHALVKRATVVNNYIKVAGEISIHALVKRATIYKDNNIMLNTDFNPRPREEGDHGKKKNTRSAVYFNPRPREEGDVQYRI